MENITTEEVMDRVEMFEERFGKVYEFGWWDMEIIKTDYGKQFIYKEFQKRSLYLDYDYHYQNQKIRKQTSKLK